MDLDLLSNKSVRESVQNTPGKLLSQELLTVLGMRYTKVHSWESNRASMQQSRCAERCWTASARVRITNIRFIARS